MPFKRTNSRKSPSPVKTTAKIRVISGKYRGRRISVSSAEGLRPTTDRVRETLFNWLMAYSSDRDVLDMFAGSGILGIEALSRGAKNCVFLEQNKRVAAHLSNNLTLLNINNSQLITGDSLQTIETLSQRFSLVFIDPPFGQSLLNQSLERLLETQRLQEDALIYVEYEAGLEPTFAPCFEALKILKTSSLVAQLLRFKA